MTDEQILGAIEEMGGDDLEGMDDEELGRRVRRRIARKPPIATTSAAGQQRMARKRTKLGIPKATFANSAAAGTTVTVEVEPQRDFQAERLIASAVSPVPSAKVGVRQVTIGDVQQFPAAQAVALDLFRFDAVNAGEEYSLCKAGTKIQVQFEVLTALGAAEGGDIVAGFVGETYGQ